MYKIILSFLLINSAFAEPFIEVGLGKSIDSCIYQGPRYIEAGRNVNCSDNPLGYAALGYTHKGFTATAEHWSSIVENNDPGVNILSIKYRYTFKNE